MDQSVAVVAVGGENALVWHRFSKSEKKTLSGYNLLVAVAVSRLLTSTQLLALSAYAFASSKLPTLAESTLAERPGMIDSINLKTWLCSELMVFLNINACWVSVAWAADDIDEISIVEGYHSWKTIP